MNEQARIQKTALRVMDLLEKEDAPIALTILTLCLAWLAGAESAIPLEEVNEAIDAAADATKHFAKLAREFTE